MSSAHAPAAAVRKHSILLVDDHPLVRHGLAQLINPQDDLEVCGEAGTPDEALAAVHQLRPNLAIVDLSLGDADGLDLVKALQHRHPNLPRSKQRLPRYRALCDIGWHGQARVCRDDRDGAQRRDAGAAGAQWL